MDTKLDEVLCAVMVDRAMILEVERFKGWANTREDCIEVGQYGAWWKWRREMLIVRRR
jgi:hypothetical protein